MTPALEDLGLRRPLRERVLWGEESAAWAAGARAALWPLELAYRCAVFLRGRAYEVGWLTRHRPAIPAVAIGNLTVGGAGKTPFTAWAAGALRARGYRPAIVLRGYGDDEIRVHALLNADLPAIVDPDRVRGVAAAARAGADVALLDDAFQHRRLAATLRILLVAAEDFAGGRGLLPRGPWREPLAAARRADLIVVTRKGADPEGAVRAGEIVARRTPSVPRARVTFRTHDVRELRGGALGRSVLTELQGDGGRGIALAGVAHPDSVWGDLARLGIRVDRRIALGDHHTYTAAQARALAEAAGSGGIVTTLKDAVKLAPLLPADASLFVLQQEVHWEDGRDLWERACDRLAAAPIVERAERAPR